MRTIIAILTTSIILSLAQCNFRPTDDTPEWSLTPRGLFFLSESAGSPARTEGLARDLEENSGQFRGKIRLYKTYPEMRRLTAQNEKIFMVGFVENANYSSLAETQEKISKIVSRYTNVHVQFEIFGLLSPFPELSNLNFLALGLEKRTTGFLKSNGRHKNALLLQEDEHLQADKSIAGTASGFFLNQTPYDTLRITGVLEPAGITKLNWSGQYYSAHKKVEQADLLLLKYHRASNAK